MAKKKKTLTLNEIIPPKKLNHLLSVYNKLTAFEQQKKKLFDEIKSKEKPLTGLFEALYSLHGWDLFSERQIAKLNQIIEQEIYFSKFFRDLMSYNLFAAADDVKTSRPRPPMKEQDKGIFSYSINSRGKFKFHISKPGPLTEYSPSFLILWITDICPDIKKEELFELIESSLQQEKDRETIKTHYKNAIKKRVELIEKYNEYRYLLKFTADDLLPSWNEITTPLSGKN